HDAVEPLAHRIRIDVGNEARDELAVALYRLSILTPGDHARRKGRGKLRPDVHLVHVCLVSCDHALIPPLLVRPICCLSAPPIRRACPTAGHSTPCSQYQPWRRSKKTRCARAKPSAVSSTRNSRSTDVPSPHFCCALSSFTRKCTAGVLACGCFGLARPRTGPFLLLPPRAFGLPAGGRFPCPVLPPDLLTLDTRAPILCYRRSVLRGMFGT